MMNKEPKKTTKDIKDNTHALHDIETNNVIQNNDNVATNNTINNNDNVATNNTINNNDNVATNHYIRCLKDQLCESNNTIKKIKINSEKEVISLHARMYKETEKSRKFALEKLLKDFLPIFDNIERSLNIIEKKKSKDDFLKIIHKFNNINDILEKCFIRFNIKKIDSINVSFDPSIHQAMSVHYTDKIEPNKIVTVMQPGYILWNTRLLRPAMVIVSKKTI